MAHHRDIISAIRNQFALVLAEYPLDPIPLQDPNAWVYQHQIMHQQFDQVLNISGFDLTDVSFRDKGLLAGWIQLNSTEHYQAAAILGID